MSCIWLHSNKKYFMDPAFIITLQPRMYAVRKNWYEIKFDYNNRRFHIEILFNKWNNYLISMSIIKITLEDNQKWWGIIVTEIFFLIFIKMKILTLSSSWKCNVSFECGIIFWMAFEIEQIIFWPIRIFVRLIYSNRINWGNHASLKKTK